MPPVGLVRKGDRGDAEGYHAAVLRAVGRSEDANLTHWFLIEHDTTWHFECLLGERQLGAGAVDVQDPNIAD